jgi:hypothetical protein
MKRMIGAAGLVAVGVVLLASWTSAGATTTASTPRCKTPGLEVWLGVGAGGAGAGSTTYPLEFTNLTGHSCHLRGYPGVSAERAGQQVGSAAGRDPAVPVRTVTLAAGATAHASLRITDVSALSGCKPVTASGLAVYPPGAFTAAQIPFRFRACSASGPAFLSVRVVQPRVGVPGV